MKHELRSAVTLTGRRMAGARGLWRANGMKKEQMGMPVIGIANSFTQMVPGHVHLHQIGQYVKSLIEEQGCFAAEFNTIAIDDGIAMGHDGMLYSLPSRDIIADSVEYMANAHKVDALVCISNCDKITPGMLMASMRLNIPTIFVSGGPMEAGSFRGRGVDLIDAMVMSADDKCTDEEADEIEACACPGCGSCSGMFTANSMNCLNEALGLALPGNGTIVATHKNIFKYFLLFLLVFVLASCDTLPHTHEFVNGKCTCGEKDPNYDPFEDNYNYVTPKTDELKLSADWEGKDFIQDGIGEVTVSQFVDGDTTHFKTKNGQVFTARYLGINTPESTYKVEPWGFAASKYTKNALRNAYKIVLQCDDINDRVDTTGERYLSWVWIISENGDSRLLNLELVEMALAKAKANDTSLAEIFNEAVYDVTVNRCRIYGYNNDPDYDYSKESKSMSLKEIKETYGSKEAALQELDKGKKVVVSGVVTRLDGRSACYIQQYDETTNQYYGVYVYGGYNTQAAFDLGNSIVIEGKIGYYNGVLQITDVSAKVRSFAPDDPTSAIYVNDIEDTSVINLNNFGLVGDLVTIHNLTCTGGSDSDTNAFTIKTNYVNASGQNVRLDIRVSNNINLVGPDGRITSYTYFNGKTIKSLTAVVSYYDYNTDDSNDGYIQMMLCSFDDIVFE